MPDLIENEHDIDLHGLEMQVSEREKQVQESKFSLESIQQEIIKSRQSIDAFVKQIDDSKAQQQKSQSQLTRLQALQDAALKGEGQELKEWLGEHEYAQLNRLAEFISVESGWERAAETVLEGFLDALCINDLDQAAHHFHGLQKGSVTFYQRQDTSSTQPLQGTLASKVTTDLAITHELQNILIAETLEQALNMRKNLQAGQSVVTPQGMWFGEHWVRYSNAVSA
jgi:chromosome segregation protein